MKNEKLFFSHKTIFEYIEKKTRKSKQKKDQNSYEIVENDPDNEGENP